MPDEPGSKPDSNEPRHPMPQLAAEVRPDGTGYLTVDGRREDLNADDLASVGAQVMTRVGEIASRLGAPVSVEVRDPDGLWLLQVHPDGRVDEAPSRPAAVAAATPTLVPAGPAAPISTPTSAPTPAPAPASALPAATSGPVRAGGAAAAATPAPGLAPAADSRSRVGAGAAGGAVAGLGDLLAERRTDRRSRPAQRGWRVGLRRGTLGLVRLAPGRAERALLEAVETVRRPLDGPRTVVVVNPKGGAHKTTAALLLAATFGLHRGGYTLAWDNNETHGTLGFRSAHPHHERTALDLLHALGSLDAQGEVRVGDLDEFVRTQAQEQFDVLASDENVASEAMVDAESFAALHAVLSRFYRVLVVDTGNNMRAANWRAAVEAADQLVVVSTIREDTAQSAAWALDALRAGGHGDAVERAVTVLSHPDERVDKDLRDRLLRHFGSLTRTVVEVPFDPSLVSGGPLQYGRLRPATQDAWLLAAAAVATGLDQGRG